MASIRFFICLFLTTVLLVTMMIRMIPPSYLRRTSTMAFDDDSDGTSVASMKYPSQELSTPYRYLMNCDGEPSHHVKRCSSRSSTITGSSKLSVEQQQQQQQQRQLNPVTPPMIPQFVGNWERLVDFPHKLGEAHGGVIGNKELLVTGGFLNFTTVNRKTYVLNLRAPNLLRGKTNETWTRLDDYPYLLGVTHAAEALYENYMYICGGYYGYPGPVQSDCFVFDRNGTPNAQYIRLPSLPEPRAGAGMIYDILHHALIFVGGTRRNVTKAKDIMDTNTTFILYLNNTAAGWTSNAKPKPYSGNHISFVSVNDTCSNTAQGIQRHYFFGGQMGQNESNSNLKSIYEYILLNDTWIPRSAMPFGRGHTGTSSMAFGCGFLVAGGAVNSGTNQLVQTDDISYYSSYNDTWTSIGKLYNKMKTPICSITFIPLPIGKHYMFCTTGYRFYTYRREIKLVPA